MIKLFEPHISNDEIRATTSVLKSKFWASGSGINKVDDFEKSFTKYTGTKSTVAVNSGSAALHLALSLFDIKNKEVLVPSLTFVSTVHSIIQNGAKPVFVEVDPATLCIDINDIKKKISKKTGAIIPVHFGGMPANIKDLKKISLEYKIPIIEDAAHACGSSFNNNKIGSHSDIVCFSFHPVKNLSMPVGGSICLNKNHLKFKKILNSKRWCGITNRNGFHYEVDKMGWNYYMNEFSAAIGLVQLKKLNKLNRIRTNIADKYFKKLNIETEFKMSFTKDCSYHLYWIRVKKRKEFMKKMESKGIQTGIHYSPVHSLTLYKKNSIKLPITEKIGREIVSIPIHPNLSEMDTDKIISTINNFEH